MKQEVAVGQSHNGHADRERQPPCSDWRVVVQPDILGYPVQVQTTVDSDGVLHNRSMFVRWSTRTGTSAKVSQRMRIRRQAKPLKSGSALASEKSNALNHPVKP